MRLQTLFGVQGPGASVKAIKGTAAKGMILPFEPMALTFHKICYYVPFPKVDPTLSSGFRLIAPLRNTHPSYL